MGSISGITPARISPVTQGTLTIAGTGFGITQGAVTVDGRAAAVLTWTDTSITATWPPRQTNGLFDWSGGSVVVTVTGATNSSVEYIASRVGRAFKSICDRMAAATVQGGYFYNWSADQILGLQVDLKSFDNGSPYPRIVIYLEQGQELEADRVAGFVTYEWTGRAEAIKPMNQVTDATQEAACLLADFQRAFMSDLSNSGITDTCIVGEPDIGRIDGLAIGSLLGAGQTFRFKVQTIENDATQNINWFATRGG
jgi:hypothetical protein